MTSRYRPLLAALLATIALLGLWQWQAQRRDARALHREAWERYLRGPLSDLLYGTTRLRPLLKKKRLSPAEKKEADDAVDHLRESSKEAQVIAVLIEKEPSMQPLVQAAPWHQNIYDLLEPWQALLGRPLAPQALDVERDLRRQLSGLLKRQRESMVQEGTLSKDETLEMNALLYSLQEDTGPLAKP